MKNTSLKNVSRTPRILLILFTLFITWYTYLTFFSNPQSSLNIWDVIFYFSPTILMFFILRIGWRHEKFEGIATLLVSFGFLLIYHVYLSLAVFFFLLFVGILFLIDNYQITHHRRINSR